LGEAVGCLSQKTHCGKNVPASDHSGCASDHRRVGCFGPSLMPARTLSHCRRTASGLPTGSRSVSHSSKKPAWLPCPTLLAVQPKASKAALIFSASAGDTGAARWSGGGLEFKLQTDNEAPLRRGAFFDRQSGPRRHEGSACSVDKVDSGAGGTPQRDVHAIVRYVVRVPDLHVLACGGAAIEHGGQARGYRMPRARRLIHDKTPNQIWRNQ
jgi:hypothetical protein